MGKAISGVENSGLAEVYFLSSFGFEVLEGHINSEAIFLICNSKQGEIIIKEKMGHPRPSSRYFQWLPGKGSNLVLNVHGKSSHAKNK